MAQANDKIVKGIFKAVMDCISEDIRNIAADTQGNAATLEELIVDGDEQKRKTSVMTAVISEIRTRLHEAERANIALQYQLRETNQVLNGMMSRLSTSEDQAQDLERRNQELQQEIENLQQVGEHVGGVGRDAAGDGVAGAAGGEGVPMLAEEDQYDHHAIEAKIEELQKNQQKILCRQEDVECRKSLIISGIGLQNMIRGQLQPGQLIPKIKEALRRLGLTFLMDHVENVKFFKNGSLRLTYKDSSCAKFQILTLRRWIGEIKARARQDPDDIELRVVQKMKFCIATPKRFHADRKILQKAAKHLKDSNEIRFFDYLVVDNKLVIKACNDSGRNRIYSYIDCEYAKQVISRFSAPMDQEE